MNYICAALECASIFAITFGLEKKRKKISIVKIPICVMAYVLYFVMSVSYNSVGVLSILGYVVIYIGVKWLYREDFLQTLLIMVMSTVIITMIEVVLMCIVSLFIPEKSRIDEYGILIAGIAFVVALIISQMKIYKLLDVLERWDFVYAIVCVLSLMMLAPALISKIDRLLNMYDYIYIVVCVIVMWMLIAKVQKYKLEEKIRKQYFDAYKDVIAQIRRRQHKIKNQINAAYGMFQSYDTYDELVEKQKEQLGQILAYELPNDVIILEEPSIIALIYEKINEAAEEGIIVEMKFACSMTGSRLSDVEWIDLIGTLLDNAIEALKSYNGEKRMWVEISCTEKGQISVCVANTFDKLMINEINRFFEMGYSTKGKDRGIGLYNVKQVVHKNKGEVLAISEEREGMHVFEIKIVI